MEQHLSARVSAPAPANDRRAKQLPPIPDDYRDHLTDAQCAAIHQAENFAWSLCFVRRPLFQERVTVLQNTDTRHYALLDEEGNLSLKHGLIIRD